MAVRLSDIGPERTRRPPRYGTLDEREGNWWGAVKNAYMLDTSAGQFTMMAATANAFGVPMNSLYRRVEPDYNPYDEDLTGFELYLDEFDNSTSPEETMMIKQMIQNNVDLRQSLDGWGGTRLFAGLLDPVNLIPVPFAIGKGFAEGARTALKYGTPVIAGTEGIRHVIDPTSTLEETAFATLGGTLFMGLIGGGLGKIPKGTMTVTDALGKFIPPEGQTGMSVGIPITTGGKGGSGVVRNAVNRIWRVMTTEVTMGEPAWKKVNPDDVRLRVNDDYGDSHKVITVEHKDGAVLLEGINNGKALQINSIYVPKELQRQGFASYAVRQAVKYAEDEGLGKIVSDTAMSDDAMFFWKALDKEGHKIRENPNYKRGGGAEKDGRVSTDGEPLFEAVPQIDADAQVIPKELREGLSELEATVARLEMEAKVFSKQVKELKKKVKDAPVAGGAKTKARKSLKTAIDDAKKANEEWNLARSQVQDANVRIAQMLDEKTIEDWDLMPTGYNTILGKLNQFPWWRLMKTDLRELAPDLAVEYQMFALKMASTPGLNNKANTVSASTGSSVENLSIIHAGKWLAASREARSIYRKMAGYGETSGEVKHFMVDQSQRVRASLNKYTDMDIPETASGVMTYKEFNSQVSHAIAKGGKHDVKEVAQAAAGYVKALEDMGEQVKEFGISATQQNIKRGIDKVDRRIAEFDEKYGARFDIEGNGKASDDVLRQYAEELGIPNPDEYIALTRRVTSAEKDNDLVVKDPVTGKDFTAGELMEQLRSEGKEPMGEDFSRRRGYTEQEISDFKKWQDDTVQYINDRPIDVEFEGDVRLAEESLGIDERGLPDNSREDAFMELTGLISGDLKGNNKTPLPPGLQSARDSMLLERMNLEDQNARYVEATNPEYMHRMWLADAVLENEDVLKSILIREFSNDPKPGKTKIELPDGTEKWIDNNSTAAIEARANEAYASILHEADSGNNGRFKPDNTDKRPWLEARKEALQTGEAGVARDVAEIQVAIIDRKLEKIADGTPISGSSGPLIEKRLNLNDNELMNLGLIESDVDTWMQHYVHRTAPLIETARVFGDSRAAQHIADLHDKVYIRAIEAEEAGNTRLAKKLYKEAEEGVVAMNDLRDIVQGNYGLNDNVDAITPRVMRMLRNFNILGAMGRSVFMALGDIGNVIMSQGLVRSIGHAAESFGAGVGDSNIKMMRTEVDLAGSVSEVILGQRYHQMTDFGVAVGSTKYPGMAKFERNLANMSQRFFLYNLLGPWTDMARRFSGGMLQSRIIENSILWKAGKLSQDEQTIMSRLNINKQQAIQFADEWERSGKLKHGAMYIANTTEWTSDQAVRTFRAGMNSEINRMVPTPGAVDKPKALLKGEWWKVLGQYRGFSIAATHRIMGAGIHQKGASKYSGIASMVGIAMMVDALKRPDYIQMPIEEQLLRAVELSGVTGIILDLNDTLERATAGSLGVRPAFGMDIRERNPNWANRMGTLGAVPNQWLTLMYGLTSDEADTDDLARSIRYMIPYNNLLWWNEAFNRAQRSAVDVLEDTSE